MASGPGWLDHCKLPALGRHNHRKFPALGGLEYQAGVAWRRGRLAALLNHQ